MRGETMTMTGFRTLTITARTETRLILRFDEAGEFYDFWPIYNVWQLQAIDGETPGYAGGEDFIRGFGAGSLGRSVSFDERH